MFEVHVIWGEFPRGDDEPQTFSFLTQAEAWAFRFGVISARAASNNGLPLGHFAPSREHWYCEICEQVVPPDHLNCDVDWTS